MSELVGKTVLILFEAKIIQDEGSTVLVMDSDGNTLWMARADVEESVVE